MKNSLYSHPFPSCSPSFQNLQACLILTAELDARKVWRHWTCRLIEVAFSQLVKLIISQVSVMVTFWFHNPKNPVQIRNLQPNTAIKPYLYRFSGRKGLIWAVGEIGKRNGLKIHRSLYLARSSRVLPTMSFLKLCYLNLIHLNSVLHDLSLTSFFIVFILPFLLITSSRVFSISKDP